MNKLNIVVSNRSKSEAFRPSSNEKWAVISIYTPGNDPANLVGFMEKLHLCFDDVTGPVTILGEITDIATLFTPAMAKEVFLFVDQIINKGIINLLVHCDAGLSRSPGIAIALDEIINGVTTRASQHPCYNSLVYKTLIQTKKGRNTGFNLINEKFTIY